MSAGIAIEGGFVVIRLPAPLRQQLYREMEPCSCRAPKSLATREVATQFRDMLADPPMRWPLREVHGLRVALADCPCRGPQPDPDSVRQRLSMGLGKVR